MSSTGSARVRLSAPLPMRRRTKEGPPALVKLAGSLVTVSAVVMVAWLIWGSRPATDELAPPAPSSSPAAIPVPAPVEGPAAEPETPDSTLEKAKIHITSEPSGATIYEGGRVRGTTPFELLPLKKDDDIELVAKLDGYQDTPFRINAAEDDQREVSVKLEKQTSPARPGNRARPAPPANTQPSSSEQRTPPSSTGTAAGELSGNPYRRTDR